MRKLASAAVAAVLFTCGGAGAVRAEDGLFVVGVMQSRPDQKGDRYSFAAETETRTRTKDGETTTTTREEFDLEILEVRRDGLRLAYTNTRAGDDDPKVDPEDAAFSRAWIGIRQVFDTDLRGEPLRVVNLADVKAGVLAGLKREAPDAVELRDQVRDTFDKAPPAELAREFIGDKLLALSGMQPRGALTPGHKELPPEYHPQPDGRAVKVVRTMDVSLFEPGACRARIERTTRTDNRGSGDPETSLTTTATVSTYDGWVIDLSEVHTLTRPDLDAERVKSLKIRRTSGPTCGGGG